MHQQSFELTEEGKHYLPEIIKYVQGHNQIFFAGLSAEAIAVVEKFLNHFRIQKGKE